MSSSAKPGVPDDEEPLIQGPIARESNVVDRLLNTRYAALTPSSFATYRKQTDDVPSRIWPINTHVRLSPVSDRADWHLRHAGTSTLWAVARGAYDTRHMFAFTVTWTNVVGGPEKLTLALESQQRADEWHAAFSDAIARAAERASPRPVSSSGEASLGSAEAALAEAGPEQDGAAAAEAEAGPGRRSRSWASVLHINGIAVYVEQQDEEGEGGAVMVSAVVRAPTKDVFKSLVQVRRTEGLGIFAGARTLEVINTTTQVVAQSWKGSGIMGGLCAPREMVLLRTWRKDEDGTYIVLYQSTDHTSAPATAGWSWLRPVRMHVQAAGFTIAPLLPKYTSGESHESLVTLVLKADLGGLLSEGRGAGLLSPLAGLGVRSMLEPVVTSIVVLRDRVEQDRFVVRPLSMAADEEAEGAPAPGAQPLALAQQLVAEQRPGAEALVLGAAKGRGAAPAAAVEQPRRAEAAVEAEAEDAWAIMGTCPRQFWSSPGSCNFKVRGTTYLTDRKKVPSALPMFELVAVDLLELEEPMFHVCKHLPSVRHSPAPFLFCVQLMVPSSPPVAVVCSWAAPMPMAGADAEALVAQYEERQGDCPPHVAAFYQSFTEFIDGDGPKADLRRNSKLKLIPNIAKGSWIIKQSVGTTPVLLGQKLATTYYRGPNFFEVDCNIGSNSVAASITNLVCGATKTLALDMGVLVEGQHAAHLPEQLLGTVRLDRLDLKSAAYFDDAAGRVVKPEELS